MGARRSHSFILLLACLALTACHKPQESYQYAVLDRDGIEEAVFSFDMDSTASYTTYFCCRYDLGAIDRESVRLFVKVVSPSGFTYRDTVVFPLYMSLAQAKSDSFTKFNIEQNWNANIEWIWRTGVSSREAGVWTVSARPESYKGLHSLGFSYIPSKKKR
ncbi:MAG: hypothetical protein J5508_01830 [Bacteroidales bacterium]|nr:hypothetical protein [Bacteroidales bacterium]